MATLRGIQGGSLVPNVAPSLNVLLGAFGTPETRAAAEAERQRQAAIQDQITDLLGAPDADPGAEKTTNQQALLRLNALDPQIGQAVLKVIQSGDEQERESFMLEAEKGAKQAAFVSGQSDFAAKQRAISSLANATAARGEPLDRLIQLQNMSEPELDLELQRMTIAGQDLQTVLAPTERFEPVTDAQGNIIGQRSTTTGKVVSDPRATTTTPTTAVGKARKDLQSGFITQAEFDTIKATPKKFQTDVGKLIGDRQMALDQFGEGSPQVQAMDEAIASDKKGEEAKLSDVGGIRKEFTKLSGDFIALRDAIGKVEQSNLNPSAAGDLALIFNFMRIQDPGSVVRESEFATAQNATSLPGMLGAAALRVVNGQRMLPAQRQDFVDTANRLFGSQLEKQRQLETSFSAIAERQGMDPANVVIDFVGDSAPAPEIIRFDEQGNVIQ